MSHQLHRLSGGIGRKLTLAFGLVVALLAVTVVVSIQSAGDINASAKQRFAGDAIPLKAAIQNMVQQMVNQETGVRGYLITADPGNLEPYRAGREAVKADLATMEPLLVRHPIAAGLVADIKPQIDAVHKFLDSEVALVEKGRQAEAQRRVNEGKELFDAFRATADKLFEDTDKFVQDAVREQDEAYASDRNKLIGLGLIATLLAVAAAWLLSRAIVPRVRTYSSFAGKVATGDLSSRLEPSGADELTRLAEHLNDMVGGLGDVAKQLQGNSGMVGSGSSEILASAEQQSAAASQQAAAINETSSAIEQLRATAAHAAAKAAEVTKQAAAASSAGDEGAQAVQNIVAGMAAIQQRVDEISRGISELSEQTQQIAMITETVGDLADQSNLLALNATIEAAKAGEQGKGFAVVADEVRNLAEQSKQATAQVQTVLEEITRAAQAAVGAAEAGTRTVEEGSELARRAGEIISELQSSSRSTDQAAQQIAATSQQQNVGMDQIAEAMKQTATATQDFVAGAERSRTSAVDLEAVSRELEELASAYRL